MFYNFFCMTHPTRGGHTQKNEKPDFRIRMNRDGSEKKVTYIKSYMSYNWSFINFFVRPLLLGAPLVNLGTISKVTPIRVGRTKKFINNQLQLIYDKRRGIGQYPIFSRTPYFSAKKYTFALKVPRGLSQKGSFSLPSLQLIKSTNKKSTTYKPSPRHILSGNTKVSTSEYAI